MNQRANKKKLKPNQNKKLLKRLKLIMIMKVVPRGKEKRL